MIPQLKPAGCIAVFILVCLSSVSARRINITMLDNCSDMGGEIPVVYATKVDYHIDEKDGLCDQVHTKLKIDTVDPAPLLLQMTLFKCEAMDMKEACSQNPVSHEELLDCERLTNDDSGPWHMFSSAMDEEHKCGAKTGEIELNFIRLKLEHLIKYLDIYDASYNTFRLKLYFKSTSTNSMRGCAELDFTLLAV